MALHCRGALTGCPLRRHVAPDRGVAPRAASSAVLPLPVKEAGLTRRPTGTLKSRAIALIDGEPVTPASSGLDFMDLVGLDDSIVWNRLQDAVTYRVLVGQSPAISPQPSRRAHVKAFNVKQLKLYRDNVTRNLAPTVARGFANAARAANLTAVSATQPLQQAQSGAQPSPPAATAPPAPLPQPGTTMAASSCVAAGPTPSPHPSAAGGSIGDIEALRRQGQQAQHSAAPIQASAAAGAAGAYSSGGCHQARRPSVLAAAAAYGEPPQRIAVRCQAQAPQMQLSTEEGSGAAGARTAVPAAAGTAVATANQTPGTGRSGEAESEPSPSVAASMVASSSGPGSRLFEGAGGGAALSGRRRGSRGAGRGPLLAAAGRQASEAGAGAGAGPAWV